MKMFYERDSFTSITRLPEKSEVYGLMHAKAVKIAETAFLFYFELKNATLISVFTAFGSFLLSVASVVGLQETDIKDLWDEFLFL